MDVVSVGRPSATAPLSSSIRECTQVTSPTSATNVGRPLVAAPTSSFTSESTLERNPMSVPNVEKLSARAQLSFNTRGFIMV